MESNPNQQKDLMRLYAVVEGRVQGVGFRYFVLKNAQELGLKGWVRNTVRGQVEVVAEGPRPVLDVFLKLLEQGPLSAQVTNVNTGWITANGEFETFTVTF